MNESSESPCGRLCACRLALAVGIIWGLGCALLGGITVFTGSYAHEAVEVLGSIYYGMTPGSWVGALLGLAWGFADGFIGTLLVVGLYNLLGCGGKCCCQTKTCPPSAA